MLSTRYGVSVGELRLRIRDQALHSACLVLKTQNSERRQGGGRRGRESTSCTRALTESQSTAERAMRGLKDRRSYVRGRLRVLSLSPSQKARCMSPPFSLRQRDTSYVLASRRPPMTTFVATSGHSAAALKPVLRTQLSTRCSRLNFAVAHFEAICQFDATGSASLPSRVAASPRIVPITTVLLDPPEATA